MQPSENYKVWMCSPGVWKMRAGGNLYLLEWGKERIMIDTGSRGKRQEVQEWLSKACELSRVTKVILTHAHEDHAGNFDLFPNAAVYMAPEEIAALHKNAEGATLDKSLGPKIRQHNIKSIQQLSVPGIEVLRTPGHTPGSICIWIPERSILFSGDTIFEGCKGRVDLPTSNPEQMMESLIALVPYNFKFLCPGHDIQHNLPLPH